MKDKEIGVALVKEACKICGKTFDSSILMNSQLSKRKAEEVESLHGKVVGYSEEPCDDCKKLCEQGFVIIGVIKELTDDKSNPYRSGNIWVIKNEAAKDIFGEEMGSKSACFLDIQDAINLGLPVDNINPIGES